MINNLSISGKLRLNIIVVMLGVLLIGASSYFSMKKLETEYNKAQSLQTQQSHLMSMLIGGLMLNSAKGVVDKNINDKKAINTMQIGVDKITQFHEKLKKLNPKIAATMDQETQACKQSANNLVSKANNKQKFTQDELKNSLKTWRALKMKIMKPLKPLKAQVDASKKEYKSLMQSATLSLAIQAVVLIFILLVINFVISRNIISHLRVFQDGLLGFFRYLNKETTTAKLIDIHSTDEIGMMGKVVNENIQKTQKTIEDDNRFLNEVKDVVQTVGTGLLNKRLDNKVQSEALEDLRNTINDMLHMLQLKVCTNINDISTALEKYAKLDFTHRISGCNSGVTMGLNNLADIINEMLVQNKQNGLTLDKSSDILLTNVDLLNKNSNEAAARLEETAAALEEITTNISSNTNNIVHMSKLAGNLTNSSKSGEKLANETTVAMDEINGQVNSINEAISVIDQIAFQTNILSLNAAVEAATAGEAGKGFAVVAQEVRNLASRSAEAANEIKKIVEIAKQKADEGKSIADKMIGGYNELNSNITDTIQLIQEVESSSKEQLQGIEQINDAVNSLDQQTQENASVASQTHIVAVQTDEIAKLVVQEANEKEFIGKNEVQAKPLNSQSSMQTVVSKAVETPKKMVQAPKPAVTSQTTVNKSIKPIQSNTKDDDEWASF